MLPEFESEGWWQRPQTRVKCRHCCCGFVENPSLRSNKCHGCEKRMQAKGDRLDGIVFTNADSRYAAKVDDPQGSDRRSRWGSVKPSPARTVQSPLTVCVRQILPGLRLCRDSRRYPRHCDCTSGDERSRLVAIQIDTAELVSPLLLPNPRVIEYSNDVVFLFHPPHLSYHLPAPLPDNSIIIVIVVSMWIVLSM